MKICYIANSRFPSERAHMTQIVHMCNAFSSLGHEVTLLATNRRTSITEAPEEYFGVPLHFALTRVSVPDIAGYSPMIPRVLRPYAFFFQRIVFTYRVVQHLKKHEYTHLYGRDEWILWFLTFFTKISIVWESHEAKFSYVARKLTKTLHHIVVISEGIRDFYTEHNVLCEKILVAHDAIDSRFFSEHIKTNDARNLLGIKTNKPVVMYIGGLESWKGAETLFEAGRGENDFEVHVVGGKKKEHISFMKKYPFVHFLGSHPYRNLPFVQQAADILVIPNTAKTSLSALYTSPLKLFSYMTSKKPIVATRIPSITNVLCEDEASFFIADDVADLRRVIKDVIAHPEMAREKALRAYTKSLLCTWENRASEILKFLTNTK